MRIPDKTEAAYLEQVSLVPHATPAAIQNVSIIIVVLISLCRAIPVVP